MKRIRSSLVAYITLFAILITWTFAEFTSWYQLQEISSALVMGAAIVAMWQWFLPAARSFRDGQDGSDFFALSIFINLFSISSQRVWINLLRWLDRPDWLVYSPVSSISALMIAYSIFLMILARETENGRIPKRNLFLVATAVLIAMIISIVTLSVFSTVDTDDPLPYRRGVSLPGIGAISCPAAKPVRVEAYCRSRIGSNRSPLPSVD